MGCPWDSKAEQLLASILDFLCQKTVRLYKSKKIALYGCCPICDYLSRNQNN